jgi:hypothetical protein
MEEGQTIRFIRGKGAPLKSPTLGYVAAAQTCGIPYADGAPLWDTVEEIAADQPLERRHVWSFDGDVLAHFKPNFIEEAITLDELVERLADREWCEKNPDHPIAYMHWLLHNRAEIVERVKALKSLPLQKLTRGPKGDEHSCYIPANATDEERAKMLEDFNAGQ